MQNRYSISTSPHTSMVKLNIPTESFDSYLQARIKSIEYVIATLLINELLNPGNLKGKAVDIATGSGPGAWVLKQYGADVTGVDTDRKVLDEATKYGVLKKEKAVHQDGIEYLKGLEKNTINLVTAFRVMHDFPALELYEESTRVLKPKGQIIVTGTFDARDLILQLKPYGFFVDYVPNAETSVFISKEKK